MANLPPLRPRHWGLLERLIGIDRRLDTQPGTQAIIAAGFFEQGSAIVRPFIADSEIDEGDLQTLRDAGALDVVSWTASLARFRVSQRGYDMVDALHSAGAKPTADEMLATYRRRRHWLASRISAVARWAILLAGISLVIWSAATGSWVYGVIGIIGAIFGFPVTQLADRSHAWLTERVDRLLLRVFEPKGDRD